MPAVDVRVVIERLVNSDRETRAHIKKAVTIVAADLHGDRLRAFAADLALMLKKYAPSEMGSKSPAPPAK